MGLRDPELSGALSQMAETEPIDEADGTARELLTWVLTGAEVAATKRTRQPAVDSANARGSPRLVQRRLRRRALNERELGSR